jgi:membrane protease YdiL (CAAX protease family)
MTSNNSNVKQALKLTGVLILMMVVGYGFNIGVGVVAAYLSYAGITVPFIFYSLSLYIPMIAIAFLYVRKKGDNLWKECGFNKIKTSTVFLTILLTVVSYPMVMFTNYFSQLFAKNTMTQAADNLVGNTPVLYMIAIALLAPVCEEILLRGFFHNRLKKLVPFTAAAILSGFWFGVFHLNLNQFCYAWLLGVVFAYVNRASGSIYTSMIMHVVINSFGGIMLYFQNIYYKSQGKDLAELAESARADSKQMITILVVTGILSIGSFFLTRLIIKTIAKREGTDTSAVEDNAVA